MINYTYLSELSTHLMKDHFTGIKDNYNALPFETRHNFQFSQLPFLAYDRRIEIEDVTF